MSAPYQAAHARQRVPLPVLARRLRTALLLMTQGRTETSRRPHEPLPDLDLPHLCNIDWRRVDDPECHPQRRKARKPAAGLAAEKAGWR